ncbi:AMMECR1 family protein [bacterium]|nr:AMMECR1 family protein [bacterium]
MRRLAYAVALVLGFSGAAEAVPLEPYRHDPALAREVRAIAKAAVRAYLKDGTVPTGVPPGVDKRLLVAGGAFVTYARSGKTRGCWGTVYPQEPTLAEAIGVAAVKALRYDYRHAAINASEWEGLDLFVSLVGPLTSVAQPAALSPMREGLMVTARGRGAVLLPGEARTARYQLAECRRKAGLEPHEPVLMFRFSTVVYGPESEAL